VAADHDPAGALDERGKTRASARSVSDVHLDSRISRS
jgi:hypothetical protein